MPELLKTVERKGKRTKPRRTLLYGTHGIGKSTFASCAPAPIILDLEDGLEDIDCAASPKLERLSEVMAWITELYEREHEFETVVVDTIDWLEKLIWASICDEHRKSSIEDFGYGKGYKIALGAWSEVLEGLDALRCDRGMAVLLLAHSQTEKYENPETEPYDRYAPCIHKHASNLVQQWCDEVLFATYRVHTVKEKSKSGDRHRGIGGDRVIRTEERPSHLAKNRLELPEEMPLAFKEYSEYAKPAGEKKAASESEETKETKKDG